jgi:hypothetical protein
MFIHSLIENGRPTNKISRFFYFNFFKILEFIFLIKQIMLLEI